MRKYKTRPAVRDKRERDELVLKNRGLVHFIAHRLHDRYDSVRYLGMDDAVQIGYVKLIRAAELWRDDRGIAFSSYACRAIKSGICQEALRQARKCAPFSNSITFSDFSDLEVPDKEQDDVLLCGEAQQTWKELPKKFRFIVWKKCVETWTYDLIGKELKISGEAVRQRYNKAVEWMRMKMEGENPVKLWEE